MAPPDAVELSQESQTPQPPPAQTEPDTQSPPVTDASETTDTGPEETISSETEPREDTTPETELATESEHPPIVEAAIDSEKELPKEFQEKYKGQQIMLNFNLSNKKEFRISTDWRHKHFPLDCNFSWIEIFELFMESSNGPTIFAGDSNKRNK